MVSLILLLAAGVALSLALMRSASQRPFWLVSAGSLAVVGVVAAPRIRHCWDCRARLEPGERRSRTVRGMARSICDRCAGPA